MIDLKRQKNQQSCQSPKPQMRGHSPQLLTSALFQAQVFLFQEIVIDILNYCKSNIKVAPFDQIVVDKLVKSNQSQNIDIYQQYFLIGIGYSKTREFVCNKYEQLIKDNLINKDYLPPQMITGIINARPLGTSGGGSTASSGGNSIAGGSSMSLSAEKSINVGRLVSTIVCCTMQPSAQISSALLYLLEGTRNKNNAQQFTKLFEQTYNILSKFRNKPIDRFLSYFLNNVVNQVQYHQKAYLQYERKFLKEKKTMKNKEQNSKGTKNYIKTPMIMVEQQQKKKKQVLVQPPPMHQFITKKQLWNTKEGMCKHQQEQAMYGKCFLCERGASHYDKTLFVPLCSMDCKNKLKRLNEECLMNDHFCFMKWLLETLNLSNCPPGSGDEVLYTLLFREVSESDKLSEEQIGNIIEIIVTNFTLQAIGINMVTSSFSGVPCNKIIENSALVMSHLIRKYPQLMFRHTQFRREKNLKDSPYGPYGRQKVEDKVLPNFFNTKVIICQMVKMLQSLPIANTSLQLTLLKALIQILAAKQSKKNVQGPPLIAFKQLYINCDCRILETNLVERILNIISQYVLNSNTGPLLQSSSSASQNLGTYTTLNMESSNALNLGVINGSTISGNSCLENATAGLEEILSTLVLNLNNFDLLIATDPFQNQEYIQNLIKQKKVKKYIQTKFIQNFNKKSVNAVNTLQNLFGGKISGKELAIIIRQNMDYQTKIQKKQQKINRQVVGVYFSTSKEKKNQSQTNLNQFYFKQPNFNLTVYKQFLSLLQVEFEGKQIDDCLRIAANSFSIAKQGQQIQATFGPLALILQPFLGFPQGEEAVATYRLIFVAYMVQTSNNVNVKESDKFKFEDCKKMCSQIDPTLSQARISNIYERIKKKPLQILIEYKGADIFKKKYLQPHHLKTEFWKYLQDFSAIEEKPLKESTLNQSSLDSTMINSPSLNTSRFQQQKIQSKYNMSMSNSQQIFTKKPQGLLRFVLDNSWEFISMGLVSKTNLKGLEQACILYGREQLIQFGIFFNHLYKLYFQLIEKSSFALQNVSQQAKLIILKLAIEYSNYVVGRSAWLNIIKIVYRLDNGQQSNNRPQSNSKKLESSYSYYEYEASDKIFTRTNTFQSKRLKQFLQAMCEFSSSQVKTDKTYTRQIYVLHHIAEVIQYNLLKFERNEEEDGNESNLWEVVWPTIRNYFRSICIYPRREIAMSAIDSYKQLTLKMMKLNQGKEGNVSHQELMSVYLYVFERSPPYTKDLIINVLLNVVSRDLKSGWDQLYTILEISDSEDKTVVMKVVSRLIQEIGLENIGNLLKLHQILIKQLRIAEVEGSNQIMEKLWKVSSHFERLDVWLYTFSKVKDIYLSTMNANILSFLYKVCNHCISVAHQNQYQFDQTSSEQGNKKKNSKGMRKWRSIQQDQQQSIERQEKQEQLQTSIEHIEEEIAIKYIHEVLQSPQSPNQVKFSLDKIHKFIYREVMSVQMSILEIKNEKLFFESLNAFKQLSLHVFFRNFGNTESNKTGFIPLWEMFLSGPNSIHLCYFMNDYFGLVFDKLLQIQQTFKKNQNIQIKKSQQTQLCSIKSLERVYQIKNQLLLQLIRIFISTSKDKVLQLSKEHPDLDKTFKEVFEDQQNLSSGKADLIEFYLSSKEYESQTIQHLVFLKIIKTYYDRRLAMQEKLKNDNKNELLSDLDGRILQILLDCYSTAKEVNNKPLFRNFLWNNEFFKGQTYLPGLMKQEFRSLELIMKHFNIENLQGKVYTIIFRFIANFTQKTVLLASKYSRKPQKQEKKQENVKMVPQSNNKGEQASQNQCDQSSKIIQIFYQDLAIWITNAEQLLLYGLHKIGVQIKAQTQKKQSSKFINHKQLFNLCLQLCKMTNSKQIIRQCNFVLEQLIIKMF